MSKIKRLESKMIAGNTAGVIINVIRTYQDGVYYFHFDTKDYGDVHVLIEHDHEDYWIVSFHNATINQFDKVHNFSGCILSSKESDYIIRNTVKALFFDLKHLPTKNKYYIGTDAVTALITETGDVTEDFYNTSKRIEEEEKAKSEKMAAAVEKAIEEAKKSGLDIRDTDVVVCESVEDNINIPINTILD